MTGVDITAMIVLAAGDTLACRIEERGRELQSREPAFTGVGGPGAIVCGIEVLRITQRPV